MWILDLPDLGGLRPAEQLWVIAQAVEGNGGPPDYVYALRRLAERVEELGWWLGEPGACGTASDRQRSSGLRDSA